jgi:hypothetical protein
MAGYIFTYPKRYEFTVTTAPPASDAQNRLTALTALSALYSFAPATCRSAMKHEQSRQDGTLNSLSSLNSLNSHFFASRLRKTRALYQGTTSKAAEKPKLVVCDVSSPAGRQRQCETSRKRRTPELASAASRCRTLMRHVDWFVGDRTAIPTLRRDHNSFARVCSALTLLEPTPIITAGPVIISVRVSSSRLLPDALAR